MVAKRKQDRSVGIDLHKDNFTSCYHTAKSIRFKKFEFNSLGLNQFIQTLTLNDNVAVEATSNARYLVSSIKNHVNNIVVVPPTSFALIKNSTKKTDKNDAALLAMFLSKNMLPASRLKDPHLENILSLAYLREHLVRMRTKCLNIVHAVLLRNGIAVPKLKLKSERSWQLYVLHKSGMHCFFLSLNCFIAKSKI